MTINLFPYPLGAKVLEYDGEHYCDVYCLAEGLGAEKVEL